MQQTSKGPAKVQLWSRPEYTQCILQFFQPFPCPVNEISLSHVPEIFPSQPSTAAQHQGTGALGSWWSRPHSGHILPAPVRLRGLSRAPGPGTRCEQLGRDSKFVHLWFQSRNEAWSCSGNEVIWTRLIQNMSEISGYFTWSVRFDSFH